MGGGALEQRLADGKWRTEAEQRLGGALGKKACLR
jgi:hypothetical protein